MVRWLHLFALAIRFSDTMQKELLLLTSVHPLFRKERWITLFWLLAQAKLKRAFNISLSRTRFLTSGVNLAMRESLLIHRSPKMVSVAFLHSYSSQIIRKSIKCHYQLDLAIHGKNNMLQKAQSILKFAELICTILRAQLILVLSCYRHKISSNTQLYQLQLWNKSLPMVHIMITMEN